ncbi:MAG: septum formation protein Maf [Phycisphaerae bacterium]|nr:septum formation protein Maf [Phycisphaerae bacterium]
MAEFAHPLVLASASPRRRLLLREAGFAPTVIESDIDDGGLPCGAVAPEAFVMALSWFKARRVVTQGAPAHAVILAADTICVHENELLGKPRDAEHAAAMLRAMRNRAHRVVTGVTIVPVDRDAIARLIFVDVATVRLGAIADAAIDEYVDGGTWQGKAGAYNYSERVAAGWPVTCDGDPTGVMGLPMLRVVPLLGRLGVRRERDSREHAT